MATRLATSFLCAIPVALGQVASSPASEAAQQGAPRQTGQPTAPTSTARRPTPSNEPLEIRVEGSRPLPPAQREPIETFDNSFIANTDAFTADEVLSNITSMLPGSQQQVVLVNGRESLIDLSTLPAEMIERIEVNTSGVRPDGRPRAQGKVINVILKERYNGANVALRERGSFAGGGGFDQLNASGGFTHGDWNGRITANHRGQNPLRASERDFSRDQNHTDEGGSDYRLPFGTPAVVKAVAGPLNGITDAGGAPVSFALAPDALAGKSLAPADFIPAPKGTQSAAGLRRFNTSSFLYLSAPSEWNGANGEITYKASPDLTLGARYDLSRSSSHQSGPPPVTAASALSLVPAAFNPFGQDIEVGLVHSGFGAVARESEQERQSAALFGQGRFGGTWQWNGQLNQRHHTSSSETHDLDPAKLAASLQSADPAWRFDPFADTRPGSANAALYPSLTSVRRSDSTSDDTRLRLDAFGKVSEGWVAPIQLMVGMNGGRNDSHQTSVSDAVTQLNSSTRNHLDSLRANANLDMPVFKVRNLEQPAVMNILLNGSRDQQRVTQQRSASDTAQSQSVEINSVALNGSLSVPWVQPADGWGGVRQLETQIGVGVLRTGSESDLTHAVGVLWSPVSPFTLRADYSRMQIPQPAMQFFALTVDYNQTLIDRRRDGLVAEDVRVISNQPDARRLSLGSRLDLSLDITPPSLRKLKLSLFYADTQQEGRQRTFAAQDILDNEAALPARVTRLPPTAEDIASGRAGEVVEVDITPFSGGSTEDRRVGFRSQYAATSPSFGLLTVRGNVQYVLESSNELLAGTQVVSTSDQEAPPRSAMNFDANWQFKQWTAAAIFNRTGQGSYAGVPYAAFGTLDLRVSYLIDKPFAGRMANSLRVGAGIQNVFDTDPPFADTLMGFRGGSALGRAYEVSVRVPFGG